MYLSKLKPMPLAASPGWCSRLHHTPVSDLLRGRLSGRLDIRHEILAAQLPEPLPGLIYLTVRRTRLWHPEQQQMARELAEGFSRDLAAGRSADELCREFNPRQTARAYRRRSLRSRPWRHRLTRMVTLGSGTALVMLLAVYAFLLSRYFLSEPTISQNYLEQINDVGNTVPVNLRGWPFYRQALLDLERWPTRMTLYREMHSRDHEKLTGYLERNQKALEAARQGAERPRLGIVFDDPADTPWLERIAQGGFKIKHDGALYGLNSAHAQSLALLARLITSDAQRAAEAGDGNLFVRNIRAVVSIAGHLRDATPLLSSELRALNALEHALRVTRRTLYDRPDLLAKDELDYLAKIIERYGQGGRISVRYGGERLAFHDMMQRIYTVNGQWEGHVTSSGIEVARRFSQGTPICSIDKRRLWPTEFAEIVRDAGLVTLTANRREVTELADRLWRQAEVEQTVPLWEWEGSAAQAEVEHLANESLASRVTYWPLLLCFPPVKAVNLRCEFMTQKRDATLAALTLVAHRQATGSWPESLAEVTPMYGPWPPIDRFTGESALYRVDGGQPRLYSTGVDRDDDGGRAHGMGNRFGERWEPWSKVAAEQERVKKTSRRRYALGPKYNWDWVLWPPE